MNVKSSIVFVIIWTITVCNWLNANNTVVELSTTIVTGHLVDNICGYDLEYRFGKLNKFLVISSYAKQAYVMYYSYMHEGFLD